MKVGDKVKVRSTGNEGIITHLRWRSSAGMCACYICEIEIQYENGDVSRHDPSAIEAVSE